MANRRRRTAGGLLAAQPGSRPLLRSTDYGAPISVRADDVGAGGGDRWVEPFLVANREAFRRLDLAPSVGTHRGVHVLLRPAGRVGAIPLLGPSTRRVAAGVLVTPRFKWSALGAVFEAVGFAVPPRLGGGCLVPGSAREVPPWILAAPVIARIADMLQHQKRAFLPAEAHLASPRGSVDWRQWATSDIPHGRWTQLPCRFSEPCQDPILLSAVRWTLDRLTQSLQSATGSQPSRALLTRVFELQKAVGHGPRQRPDSAAATALDSEFISAALEAMAWVSEERGLGGARALDGLAWDVCIDQVWEAWVSSLMNRLAPRLGLVSKPFGAVRRRLTWDGPFASMGSLAPDIELRSAERVVWIDAKYKPHLSQLCQKGWNGLSEDIKAQHRADLHQALAYASLAETPRVDTVLAYPDMTARTSTVSTIAHVTTGKRQVRLILASIPFGFRGPSQQEEVLNRWRELLAS